VLVGGAVAVVSGLVVALMTERRSRSEWRRQARLASAAKTIRALHSESLSRPKSRGRWRGAKKLDEPGAVATSAKSLVKSQKRRKLAFAG
jgi:hypothetical protein